MNMTFAKINGIYIHYQLEGDKDAPVLMLDIRGQDIRGQIPINSKTR